MANIQLIETCTIADDFAKCEITGSMSDCIEVKIYKDQS